MAPPSPTKMNQVNNSIKSVPEKTLGSRHCELLAYKPQKSLLILVLLSVFKHFQINIQNFSLFLQYLKAIF